MDGEHWIENGHCTGACEDLRRKLHRVRLLLQSDRFFVGRQAIPGRTVERGEGLQLVERALFLEDMGKAAHGVDRGVDAGAAAGAFLQRIDMRGGVRAEEEALVARSGGGTECKAMVLALGDR